VLAKENFKIADLTKMLTTKLRSSETQDKQQPDRLKSHQLHRQF